MNSAKSYQKTTGVLAITAGILALLSLVIGLAGVDYDFEVFSDTSSLIAAGADAAVFIRWSYWLNMVGNYLFLMPLALLLYKWRKEDSPDFARLFTGSGLIYMLLGAAGSAILAEAWPFLMDKYEAAVLIQPDMLPVLTSEFQVVNAIAEAGLHGVIQNFCGAVWFLGMGYLIQKEVRAIGIFTLVVGFFLLLNTLGNMLNIEALSLLGLTANILFGPIWAIWIGVFFFSRK
jgi:hypothetical protein